MVVYNTTNNYQELQDDFTRLEQWERLWDIWNSTMQKVRKYPSVKRECTRLPLYLHGIEIPKADSIKYLGVTVDAKINWNAHVNSSHDQWENRFPKLQLDAGAGNYAGEGKYYQSMIICTMATRILTSCLPNFNGSFQDLLIIIGRQDARCSNEQSAPATPTQC